jgi:hypothetical protein
MGTVLGIIVTLGLVALAVRSLVTAIEDRRPVKASLLVLVIVVLLIVCTNGGYLSVSGGVEVDHGP